MSPGGGSSLWCLLPVFLMCLLHLAPDAWENCDLASLEPALPAASIHWNITEIGPFCSIFPEGKLIRHPSVLCGEGHLIWIPPFSSGLPCSDGPGKDALSPRGGGGLSCKVHLATSLHQHLLWLVCPSRLTLATRHWGLSSVTVPRVLLFRDSRELTSSLLLCR